MAAKKYTTGFVSKYQGHWRLGVDEVDEDGARRRRTKLTKIPCSAEGNAGRQSAMTALRIWREGLVAEAEDEAAREAEAAKWRASEASVYDYTADYLSRHNCKSSTMDGYLATAASLRDTPLGAMRLQDVRSRDVEEWEQALLDRGLSTTTVAGKHACLAMVIKYASPPVTLRRTPWASCALQRN